MSDYESHSGKILPIKRLENESDFDYFKRATGKEPDAESLEESIMEALYEADLYEDFFYVKDTLYRNLDHKRLDPYESECILEGNDVDGYTYNTMFYNGGTCLSEMIEEALEKKNK